MAQKPITQKTPDYKLNRQPDYKRDRYEARKFKQALRDTGMKGGF